MNPNLIIHNAKIYTVASAHPWAEAVACAGGQIVAAGSNNEILNLAGPGTHAINAEGRLLLPGLIDAHVHFLQYAVRNHQVSLFGSTDFEEVRRRVQEAVRQVQPNQWVQGWGWDEHRWDVQPTAALLDEIAPDTPMVLARVDMHTWWANSAALKQAGITRETPDPPESRIERDAEGNPTGIFREWGAIALIQQHIPKPETDTLYRWMKEAMGKAHALGLTGIHDQRVENEGWRSFSLWQTLRRQNKLDLRVHMNIAADFLPQVSTLGLKPGFGDDRLWIGHAKAFADGTMGSQTAWMVEPFEGKTDNLGIVVTSPEELSKLAGQARRAGFSMSVHAIGDRAVREVAGVLSEFPPDVAAGQLPHRIEHVQVIHPDDLNLLSKHGIFASMQPVHLQLDWRTAGTVWGARARYTYAFQSLLKQGTPLAFGSDAPVAPINPMLGFYAALTRQDTEAQPENGWYPTERINLETVIHAYTMGPAQLAGKSHLQGSISAGKWADMIILNQDLFEIPPAEILNTQVDMTIFNGDVVFSR